MQRLDPRAILAGNAYSREAIKRAASSGKAVLIVEAETADRIERALDFIDRVGTGLTDEALQPRLIPAD